VIWAYAGAAAIVVGFGLGWQVHGWKTGKEEAVRLRAAQELANEQQRMVNRASAKHEVQRADREIRERVVIREVQRVLEKPVYREQCLDDDGLRILTEDIAASNARRELGSAVPAASSPGR
jgi:hypothetical protein